MQTMNTNPQVIGKKLAIIGLILQLGPYIGLLITAFGMLQTFSHKTATTDINILSSEISHVIIATLVGLIFGLLGIVMIFISLLRYRYRAEWFFWLLTIYGTLNLFVFPLGTIPGLALLIFCITNRKEFFRNEPS